MRLIFRVSIAIQILFWISSTTGLNDGFNYASEITRTRVKRAESELTNNEKPKKADMKCALPKNTPNENYTVTCRDAKKCGKKPDDKVPELTTLLFNCNHGYANKKMPLTTFCINGTWVPPIEKCKKTCKKLEPENVELSCSQTDGKVVKCNGTLVQGTKVHIQCASMHHVEVPVTYNEITCHSNGEWSNPLYKCTPDCGKSHAPTMKLIASGTNETLGEAPWNVAIYDITDKKKPTQICGGTIISPQLIVSAAHCFFDDDKGKLFNAKKYEIAVAKIKRDYSVKDNSLTAFYKIHEITLSDKGYNGPQTDYAGDIAMLRTEKKMNLSYAVLPACLELDSSKKFAPSKKAVGKLVGWGYDLKNNPSDVLLTANLPYISRSDCLKIVSSDFQSSISIDKFCAGSVNVSGPGARPGDSGEGLMFIDSQSKLYFLRGVVSIKDPSTSTSIAAFTDVSFYVDWISKTLSKVEKSVSKKS